MQTYFLFSILEFYAYTKRPIPTIIVCYVPFFVLVYVAELLLTIQLFGEIKATARQCNTQLKNLKVDKKVRCNFFLCKANSAQFFKISDKWNNWNVLNSEASSRICVHHLWRGKSWQLFALFGQLNYFAMQ